MLAGVHAFLIQNSLQKITAHLILNINDDKQKTTSTGLNAKPNWNGRDWYNSLLPSNLGAHLRPRQSKGAIVLFLKAIRHIFKHS